MNDNIIPQHAHFSRTDDFAFLHIAACDNSPWDLEGLAHFSPAKSFLFELRIEKSRHGRFHIIQQIVDNPIDPDINPVALGGFPGIWLRTYVKSNNYRIGGGGKQYV